MRNTILILLLTAIASVAAFGQEHGARETAVAAPKDPTVSEILANYVRAIGGAEKFAKVESRVMRGGIEMSPLNVKGTLVTYAAPKDKLVSFLNIDGLGEFAEGFDGTRGWSVNPIQGLREKSAEEIARQRITGNFFRETTLGKLYSKLRFAGRVSVEGNETYLIEADAEGLGTDKLYFDTKTGLLSRYDTVTVAPEGRFPTSTLIDDYRSIDGMMIAFRSRTKLPQYEVIIRLTEVKHNAEFDHKLFSIPTK